MPCATLNRVSKSNILTIKMALARLSGAFSGTCRVAPKYVRDIEIQGNLNALPCMIKSYIYFRSLFLSKSLSTSSRKLGQSSDENDDHDRLSNNPFLDKYAEKIKKAKDSENRKPVTKEEISYRMNYEANKWRNHMKSLEQKLESRKATSASRKSVLPKTLDDILKIDEIVGKSKDEIAYIWTEYFKSKQSISAVIPAEVFDRIQSRAKSCPTFIYPLVKDQGYEFILAQFQNNQCFFTSLLNYQVHGENAPWQMNLTHYTELKDGKGIVLMLGEIDDEKMNILEAQCLAQQLQMFYATADEERFNMVHTFNKDPTKFKHMDVVKEVEASRLIERLNLK